VLAPAEPLLFGCRNRLAVNDQRRRRVMEDCIYSEDLHLNLQWLKIEQLQ
jgi:hypothetical protein